MCSVISEISQEIPKLKSITLCAKCASNQDLRRLTNCGHLICLKCLNCAASKCPICRISIRRKDSFSNDNLQDILSNIDEIRNVNHLEEDGRFNFDCPQITPIFALESTHNKRDHKGETRLHKDCRDGNMEKVEALLQMGVDANVQDYAGWTALHEAVTANKVNVVKLLLNYGAFVSVPGQNYMTPLHIAAEENNIPITKLLVQYGANLQCFNKNGKTPMDLCNNSKEMRTALCLTPRGSYMYKVYTIPQPKVFFINVSNEDIQKLKNLPGVSVSTERSLLNEGNTTYVVVGNDKPNIKCLQAAMLQGSCIVRTKWIEDFMTKSSRINPMDYIPDIPRYALNKAMMNMFNKLPKLFDGLRFYFYHTNMQKIGGFTYTVEDFKTLILVGGGKIVTRRPVRVQEDDIYYPYHADKNTKSATTIYYWIYDETKSMPTEKDSTGIQIKSAKWLLACINNFIIKA